MMTTATSVITVNAACTAPAAAHAMSAALHRCLWCWRLGCSKHNYSQHMRTPAHDLVRPLSSASNSVAGRTIRGAASHHAPLAHQPVPKIVGPGCAARKGDVAGLVAVRQNVLAEEHLRHTPE